MIPPVQMSTMAWRREPAPASLAFVTTMALLQAGWARLRGMPASLASKRTIARAATSLMIGRNAGLCPCVGPLFIRDLLVVTAVVGIALASNIDENPDQVYHSCSVIRQP